MQRQRAWKAIGAGFLVACVAAGLVAGIAGGLVRAGAVAAHALPGRWVPQAVGGHAFLMIGGFLGSVVALERAVAVKLRWAYAAPLLGGAAAALQLAGAAEAAAGAAVVASAVFVAVGMRIFAREREPHTASMLVGALAWLAGNASYAIGLDSAAVVPWWFAFLVLTIAGERLELTRLMRRRAGASLALAIIVAALVVGAALSAAWPGAGAVVYGAALVALAAWLLAFDIARRTVRAQGLGRYIAVCLLGGYLWLGVAGFAWISLAWSAAARDAALHALALGFVFAMIFAHAPVIVPALTGVRLAFGLAYYLPLLALHASLALRLAVAGSAPAGAAANAAAIGLFALTLAGSALAGQRHAATAHRVPHASAHD